MINVFSTRPTVVLNCEEIKRYSQIISKVRFFMSKYNWDGIKYLSKIRLRKIIQQLLLLFYTLKKWKYVPLMFQKLSLIVKNK